MKRNTKIVIGLLVVLAVALGAIGYWAMQRKASQTAAATATVVGTEVSGRSGKRSTVVTFSFQTAAGPAQGRDRVRGDHASDYPAGRQLRVCYDPANPNSLRMANGPCG